MLFDQGVLNLGAVGDRTAAEILRLGTDRASGPVRPSDFLSAALTAGGPRVLATFERALPAGVAIRDIVDSINVFNPGCTGSPTFDGRRERFSPEGLKVVDDLDLLLGAGGESALATALESLLVSVLTNLDERERRALSILPVDRASALFAENVKLAGEPLLPLFDLASGRLRSEEFTEATWAVLEQSATLASDLGYDRVLRPHCLLALLGETEGVAEHLVRLQVLPEIGPGHVAQLIAESFRIGPRRASLELTRDEIGESMVPVLQAAQREASLWGAERVDTVHLLAGLLDDLPARLASTLRRPPLNLDLEKMRRQLVDHLRDARSTGRREVAFRLPTGLLPSEDLTFRVRTTSLPAALHVDAYIETMTRAMFRREHNHLLVTGSRGVGKTTLTWELARQAGSGDIDFLGRKRFLWVDCDAVGLDDSRETLAAVLGHVAGRTDIVLCLDGLGPMLRAESGGNNKVVLRAALKAAQVHLIGVMSDTDYEDLLSADHEILEFFTRVPVAEPVGDAAVEIVSGTCAQLAGEYELAIAPATIARGVQLTADYILNERLPAKAIKIFRRACEEVDYERKQLGRSVDVLDIGTVTRVISDISGVPEATLAGTVGEADYERDLGAAVVGQPLAVAAAASQLDAIKSGLPDPGKPASVMLFAGLTGVGKTELAKTLARFYSSSKRLQTYTMANFTQPHSVSGIVGVPPGYVGHEQGGRLINDLKSDPYCVFLLDEAEKAHPDIWKLFLTLFDEAWIVDQRAVKAFADRAIFILTSNVGADIIARRSQAGTPMEQVVAEVREELSTVRHKDSNELVFPPEFLARIQQIVIFNPLDEDGMKRICAMAVARMTEEWLAKRDKRLLIPEVLIGHIARQSHVADARSGFKEGGRIVRKLIGELIRDRVLAEARARKTEYEQANVIELQFLPSGAPMPNDPAPSAKVVVHFRQEPTPTVADCVTRVASDLRRAAQGAAPVPSLHAYTRECLDQLQSQARLAGDDEGLAAALEVLQAAIEELSGVHRRNDDEAAGLVTTLASALESLTDPIPEPAHA